MTNEELLSVAEIVERATNRFNAQAAYHRERFDEHVKLIASMKADHEAKMVEHRAAFGARTEADAKIIAGLREESAKHKAERDHFYQREGIEQKRRMDAESERDGLLTQVHDMRAEIRQRAKEQDEDHKTIVSLISEREALRAEIAELKTQLERLTSWAAKNQAARDTMQTEIERLRNDERKAYQDGEALRAEVADLRGIVDMVHASLGIKRGDHIGNAIAQLKAQTPKRSHPVAVGEYLRRLTGFSTTPAGEVAQVLHVDCDAPTTEYTVKRPNGQQGVWSESGCEPCDPPATHAEPDLTQLHAKGKEAWSDVPNATQWVEEMRGNSEATHDTEAGKAVAERTVRTEPVAEEIKVGDMAKVVGASGDLTAQSDIGKIGEVLKIDSMDGTVLLSGGAGWVDHRDVRKVTT